MLSEGAIAAPPPVIVTRATTKNPPPKIREGQETPNFSGKECLEALLLNFHQVPDHCLKALVEVRQVEALVGRMQIVIRQTEAHHD